MTLDLKPRSVPRVRQADKRDLRPEYVQYRDQGCHLYGACLSCPLERCYYEDPSATLRRRSQEMARLRRAGYTNRQIARAFGVSIRTVQRALRKKESVEADVSASTLIIPPSPGRRGGTKGGEV